MTTPSSEDKTVAEAMPFDAFQIRSFTARASSVGDAHELSGDSIYEFARMLWGAFVAHNRTALAASGSKGGDERAWLVETKFSGRSRWWNGRQDGDGVNVTDDHRQAIRLARKEDAERVAAGMHMFEATEHIWLNAAAPAEQSAAMPEGQVSAAWLLAEQVLHMDLITERGKRARELARQVLNADAAPIEGECAEALRQIASYLGAGGYNAPAVDANVFREKIMWGIEQLRAPAAIQTKGKDDSPSRERTCDIPAVKDAGQAAAGHMRFYREMMGKTTPQTAAPAAQPEPVAWESSPNCGLKRFVTDSWLQRQPPEIRRWYSPYRCPSCAAAPPPAAQSDEARDAWRYRWLREHYSAMVCGEGRSGARVTFRDELDQPASFQPSMLDTAVDAALAQKGADHG